MQRLLLRTVLGVVTLMAVVCARAEALTITLTEAGTLPTRIPDSEKLTIRELKVVGQLNGTDMLFLREMAGRNFNSRKTHGLLTHLDLGEAQIVSGGTAYVAYYAGETRVECRTVADVWPEWVFSGCDSLEQVVMPASVTAIGDYSFRGCNLLQKVVVPASVSRIGAGAFDGCFHLTDIQLPQALTELGSYAFRDCQQLEQVTLGNQLKRIGAETFCRCRNLRQAALPVGIQSIGERAFSGCEQLAEISLPMFVLTIGEGAFRGCKSIAAVTIPLVTNAIGTGAFADCASLQSITVAEGNANYQSIGGALYSADATELLCCPGGTSGSFAVAGGVTTIGRLAFEGCTSLTTAVLPEGLTTIGESAFQLSAIESLLLPSSVTTIGDGAFWGCHNLRQIDLPAAVSSIGSETFADCQNLQRIGVSEANAQYSAQSGVLFNKDCNKLVCYPCGRKGPYAIPEGVVAIGDAAFEYCEVLQSIAMPASLARIGEGAFYMTKCDRIVSLATTPPFVADYAFEFDTDEMNIYVPEASVYDYLDAKGWDAFYVFNYHGLSADELQQEYLSGIESPVVRSAHLGSTYDLGGRRLDGTAKAGRIYIKGGNKYIR